MDFWSCRSFSVVHWLWLLQRCAFRDWPWEIYVVQPEKSMRNLSIGEAKLEQFHGYQVLRSNRIRFNRIVFFSPQKQSHEILGWPIWGPYQVAFNDHFGVFAAFCGQLIDLTFYSRYNTAKHGLQLYYIGISRSIGTTCRRQPVSSAARDLFHVVTGPIVVECDPSCNGQRRKPATTAGMEKGNQHALAVWCWWLLTRVSWNITTWNPNKGPLGVCWKFGAPCFREAPDLQKYFGLLWGSLGRPNKNTTKSIYVQWFMWRNPSCSNLVQSKFCWQLPFVHTDGTEGHGVFFS